MATDAVIAKKLPGDETIMKTAWFWETGLDTRYRYISNSFESLTGIPLAKALGRSVCESWLADGRNRQSVTTILQLMAARGSLENIELRCKHPNGAEHVFQIIGEPIFDDAGDFQGYRGVGTDISAQQQTETALRKAKRTAEQADAMKTRFLTAASHDLQQPLQTISTVRTLLACMIEEPTARRHIDALGETVESMRTMLNALLDVTRPQTDTLASQVRHFPVSDVLAHMQSDFHYAAADKGLQFHVVPSSAILETDPNLLQEIIRNLVANAIKYTERGKILLGCRWRGTAVRIEVWDTGIGIAEGQRQHIFEEFCQLNKTNHAPRQGLGLGLAIAEQLTRLLGLSLNFQSTPGKGSIFAVTVPLATPMQGNSRERRLNPASDSARYTNSILYVEDNSAVLDAMHYLLSLAGFKVFAVSSAKHVNSLLREPDFRPDIIVSDYRLPAGATGADVIASVRQKFCASIPAIVMTGDSSLQSAHAAKRLGCELLSKPVDGEYLVRAVRRLLDGCPLQR